MAAAGRRGRGTAGSACTVPLLIFYATASAYCTGRSAVFAAGHGRREQRASELAASADSLVDGLCGSEVRVVQWLASQQMGQAHLLDGWEHAGVEDKRRLIAQVLELDSSYPEDASGRRGLEAYVAHAKALLAESAANKNPFDGYSVELPVGERQEIGSEAHRADERLGLHVIQDAVFVLVAGGLGERLGFGGIKVALPTETLTEATFLETYAMALRAMQEGGDANRQVPLVIMTSEDTHELTQSLLEKNDFFGLSAEQLHLLKQANVPALETNDAAFALSKDDRFQIQTKPHGHGDVHTLLYQSGLLPRFASEGRKYIVFFQDTNVLAFKAIPAALGVSERLGLEMNSLTVPRSPGEAAGAICKLVQASGEELVINVEYNQLDALLQATEVGGDVADESGYSPYPGNVNTLILSLKPYMAALQATGGSMPEFVNPKYANAERSVFKKPTRLECMMQDFPKLLRSGAPVGFTDFERWFSFSPVKNAIEEAVSAHAKGVYAASPGAGEEAVYAANARLLRLAGAAVAPSEPPREFLGLPLALKPAIALSPRFALTVEELFSRVPGGAAVAISSRSTLVLDGAVELHSLELDGALVIHAGAGVRVRVRDCKVINAGWEFRPIEEGACAAAEAIAIRGYVVSRIETVEISEDTPGDYELIDGGVLRKI
mmetsp:Transcript_41941/g.98286  ORF Transcript_41941/g.98286 Transcript_41941/m.98286 type:complete len:665 (-) Transcript_41941:313-2307(-)